MAKLAMGLARDEVLPTIVAELAQPWCLSASNGHGLNVPYGVGFADGAAQMIEHAKLLAKRRPHRLLVVVD
eukprot:973186-Lingulodinium_polyedra.AAC.1